MKKINNERSDFEYKVLKANLHKQRLDAMKPDEVMDSNGVITSKGNIFTKIKHKADGIIKSGEFAEYKRAYDEITENGKCTLVYIRENNWPITLKPVSSKEDLDMIISEKCKYDTICEVIN